MTGMPNISGPEMRSEKPGIDLLDEATRLHYEVIRDDRDAEWRRLTAEHDLVPALVERVQRLSRGTQEMTRQTKRILAERDEARGKLDKVRARLDSWDATALRDVLAILDGKTGD